MGKSKFAAEKEALFEKVSERYEPGSEQFGEYLAAIGKLQDLEDKEAEIDCRERKARVEELKLQIEQERLERERSKSNFEKVVDVFKIVAGPIATIVTVGMIIVAEKKDDLFLGSKALSKVPKP